MKKLLEAWTHRLLNPPRKDRLNTQQIEDRVWAVVVIAVTIILFGIVFSLLYSVTFVTQPIKSMAPIDQAYPKMLNDIVLLIVGGIGGVIGKKGVAAVSNAINNLTPHTHQASCPAPTQTGGLGPYGGANAKPFGAMPVFVNPELDESWVPPPPPSTPPNYVPPEVAEIAAERAAARTEA